MYDPRLDRLAQVIVRYSSEVRKGDVVCIKGPTVGEPLAVAIHREVVRAGAHPWVRLVPEDCDEDFVRHASDEQLAMLTTLDRHTIANINVYIGIWASANTKARTTVNPKKQALLSKGRRPWMNAFMKRTSLPKKDPKRMRWTGTAFPTHGAAHDAEMSLREYADFVFRAGKLHLPNPVAAWKKLGTSQQRLADVMNKGREVHITAPGGTDIRFGVAGRKWINCDGHANFPDGEVFTAPMEDATEGEVYFPWPAIYGGREVQGVRLRFKAGRCVEASAEKNEKYLVQMLDLDKGARVVGELALGTNYEIKQQTKDILFDEKIGGTFHMALGAAYPEAGGTNVSGLHWDMVCDLHRGGVVKLDGKIISKNGKFQNAAWPR